MQGLTLYSYRLAGLDPVIGFVFPNAEHRVCMRHLYKNFRSAGWVGNF